MLSSSPLHASSIRSNTRSKPCKVYLKHDTTGGGSGDETEAGRGKEGQAVRDIEPKVSTTNRKRTWLQLEEEATEWEPS